MEIERIRRVYISPTYGRGGNAITGNYCNFERKTTVKYAKKNEKVGDKILYRDNTPLLRTIVPNGGTTEILPLLPAEVRGDSIGEDLASTPGERHKK